MVLLLKSFQVLFWSINQELRIVAPLLLLLLPVGQKAGPWSLPASLLDVPCGKVHAKQLFYKQLLLLLGADTRPQSHHRATVVPIDW